MVKKVGRPKKFFAPTQNITLRMEVDKLEAVKNHAQSVGLSVVDLFWQTLEKELREAIKDQPANN